MRRLTVTAAEGPGWVLTSGQFVLPLRVVVTVLSNAEWETQDFVTEEVMLILCHPFDVAFPAFMAQRIWTPVSTVLVPTSLEITFFLTFFFFIEV